MSNGFRTFYSRRCGIHSMVDEKDELIMDLLKQDARMTYVEIGKSVGLSEGAVRNRIQNLVNTKVIKKFTIERSTSHGVRAVTMIAVDPSTPTFEVSKAVNDLEGVESIYEVTGEYDIMLVSMSSSIDGINQCIEDIRKIHGVEKTNTIIVLRTIYSDDIIDTPGENVETPEEPDEDEDETPNEDPSNTGKKR